MLRTIRSWGSPAVAVVTLIVLGAYALLASYVYLAPSLPTVDAMRAGVLAVPLRVYARGGELIGQIGEKRRLPVAYDDIPVLVREAFVAAEDQRFFEHHGFDYSGVLRAMWVDLTSGDFSQGASTITMQAARNMFLSFDKTISASCRRSSSPIGWNTSSRKEQILADLSERDLPRTALLRRRRGGGDLFRQAARSAVDRRGRDAGWHSAGALALQPGHQSAGDARRGAATCWQQMLKLDDIDAAQAQRAAAETGEAHDHGILYDADAPYVAEMARADLVARFGEDAVNDGYASTPPSMAGCRPRPNRAVQLGLIEYDRRHGYRGPLTHVSARRPPRARAQFEALLADPGTDRRSASRAGGLGRADIARGLRAGQRLRADRLGWPVLGAPTVSDTRTGAPPQQAADVLQRGDVVYVVSNGHGVAQLARAARGTGALVALDPNDGAVVALVGGFDYFDNKFNRATQARRQPGSGFKPFLYSCALENGFTPCDHRHGCADRLRRQRAGEDLAPGEQRAQGFDGPMRLREALVHSRNLVTIRVVRQLGVDTAIGYASQVRLQPGRMPKDLTLALGSLPATPLQMVTGYAVFANGGYRSTPTSSTGSRTRPDTSSSRPRPKVCERCDAAGMAASPLTAAPLLPLPRVRPLPPLLPPTRVARHLGRGTPPVPRPATPTLPPDAQHSRAPPRVRRCARQPRRTHAHMAMPSTGAALERPTASPPRPRIPTMRRPTWLHRSWPPTGSRRA